MNRYIVVLLFFLFPAMNVIAADIPMVMNYQGAVKDNGGVALNGDGYFKFAMVNAAGDLAYWVNDGSTFDGTEPAVAITIPVTNGLFSARLGDTGLTNMPALSETVFNNTLVYLRVWFSFDGTNFEVLSPDTQIVSAGFAFKAQVANELAIGADHSIQLSHDQAGVVMNSGSDVSIRFDTDSMGGDRFQVLHGAGNSPALLINKSGDVGIGTTTPSEKLSVGGTIESTTGGFKFPDGTVQSSAAVTSGVGWATIVKTLINVRSSDVTLATVALNIPASGYVVVRFDGNATADNGDRLVLAASNTENWGVNDGSVSFDGDGASHPFSHTRVYSVSSGSNTFYAVARNHVKTAGNGLASIYATLIATYYPESYQQQFQFIGDLLLPSTTVIKGQ